MEGICTVLALISEVPSHRMVLEDTGEQRIERNSFLDRRCADSVAVYML